MTLRYCEIYGSKTTPISESAAVFHDMSYTIWMTSSTQKISEITDSYINFVYIICNLVIWDRFS